MIVAGTGHRPKYCPCKYNEKHPWLTKLKWDLIYKIKEVEPKVIISGMALGWDLWLAKAALYMGIELHAYVPFEGQGSNWPKESQKIYNDVLEACDNIIYVSKDYDPGVFIKRDQAMVDAADQVWALWNPQAQEGGTFITVKMAQTAKKPIINFWRD